MIIPDNISPFPVLPASHDSEKKPRIEIEGFVCEDTIREILAGPLSVSPLVTTQVPIDEGFAGRNDLVTPVACPFVKPQACPFVALSSDEAYADEASMVLESNGPHPALAEPTHVAPTITRVEASKGWRKRHNSDRWWVLGMGVALLAVLGSGTVIEMVSNEALRRSQITEAVETATPVAKEKSSDHQPLAISNPEYPAP
ncbi:hypothetical protein [Haloferula sp.]|uniref:hypothetical protein n=1 Tax=Haloferula sp. TaxID=2497595 RepID=UPI003C73C19E